MTNEALTVAREHCNWARRQRLHAHLVRRAVEPYARDWARWSDTEIVVAAAWLAMQKRSVGA